jgi:glycosyltransferase involved in cell wall biosynthesis
MEEEYGKEIKKLVDENAELSKHIHFVGMLTGDAKWGAIYGCEAFVLPSHQENFGIAVAEALACRKPVLISNQVNIWKEIESVNAGFIDSDTVEGTLNTLSRFVSLSTEDKQKMQKQAYMAYSTFFDVRVTAKNLINALC